MAKIRAYIVPTTHWDREWVMTLGQYQIRLGHMLDQVLELVEEYPEYRFMLDGQSIAITDYLAICPQNRERLSAALKSGAVTAGPWYALADQEMESYESTVRNLHYGIETVRALGGQPMMECYLPDSFGCMAALPQLLNGFEIDTANFSRGNPGLEKTECLWSVPDGSKGACAAHGQGNGLFLSCPDIWIDIFAESGRKMDPEMAMKEFMKQAWDGKGTVTQAFNMGEAVQVQAQGSLVQGEQVRRCRLSEQEEACTRTDSIDAVRFAPLTLRLP